MSNPSKLIASPVRRHRRSRSRGISFQTLKLYRKSLDRKSMDKIPDIEYNEIGVFISSKIKTLKIKINPLNIKTHIVVSASNVFTISEIEVELKKKLNQAIGSDKEDNIIDFDDYSLYIDGLRLQGEDILNIVWDGQKSLVFQSPLIKEKEPFKPKRLSVPEVKSAPSTPRKIGNIETLEQQLIQSNHRIMELEHKLNEINKKSPINPTVIEDIKVLGAGGCALVKSVYVDGWICAMKEIKFDEIPYTGEIELFEKLPPHKNIVQYFSHRIIGDKLQIFLKQYTGTLRNIIEQRKSTNKPFAPSEIYDILYDISSGLKFLHKKNVIHRDLKAENIFYQNKGRGIICAIGDMDTAKIISQSKARTIIGTPAFIAPEVLTSRNENPYTTKADTLDFPYMEIKKSWLISQAIIEGILPKLPKLGNEYNHIIELFNKCVEVDPKQRPKAKQLHTMIKQLQKQELKLIEF